jgi:hypothetical protein
VFHKFSATTEVSDYYPYPYYLLAATCLYLGGKVSDC